MIEVSLDCKIVAVHVYITIHLATRAQSHQTGLSSFLPRCTSGLGWSQGSLLPIVLSVHIWTLSLTTDNPLSSRGITNKATPVSEAEQGLSASHAHLL